MKLIVNGCSNSVAMMDGVEYPDKCWGYFLSKHLNSDLINLSRRGGSLERILRTTIEYFSNNEKGLYIIGLPGGISRWETQPSEEVWVPRSTSRSDITTKEYATVLSNTTTYWWVKHYIYFISLQSFLKENNIPYLVFNSGVAFNDSNKFDQYAKYIDEKYFIGKYNSFEESMAGYLKKKRYKQDFVGHFYADGQENWADYLHERIVSMTQTEN